MSTTAPIKKGWLQKAVIHTNAPKYSIIDVLRKRMAGWEIGRARTTLHASDVTKPYFCPRNEALLDLAGITHGKKSYVATALRVTYDMGNETARRLTEDWAGECALGNWRCRRCGALRTMCRRPKKVLCQAGNNWECHWKYEEVVIVSVPFSISGSLDLLFDVGAPKVIVTELKTLAADDFDKIVTPLPEHRLRTNLYMRLIADSDSPYKELINLHEGRVLYTSRGYGRKNDLHNGEILPFKEYVVERNDDDLEIILKKAKQLKVFREEKLMPSGICHTAVDKAAKQCENCVKCFSGAFPSKQEPL